MVNEEGGVGSKVKDINRKIAAAKQNHKNATETANKAHTIYEDVKEEYDGVKVTFQKFEKNYNFQITTKIKISTLFFCHNNNFHQ